MYTLPYKGLSNGPMVKEIWVSEWNKTNNKQSLIVWMSCDFSWSFFNGYYLYEVYYL